MGLYIRKRIRILLPLVVCQFIKCHWGGLQLPLTYYN